MSVKLNKGVFRSVLTVFLLAPFICAVMTSGCDPKPKPDPTPNPRQKTIIGIEYVRSGIAADLYPTGISGVKYLPDKYRWGAMQKSATSAIDFSVTDSYVSEYQKAGFQDIIISFKPHCEWAAKGVVLGVVTNPTPKPEYMQAYANWISSVVERYDKDGKNDMPNLKYPVKFYEIGVEFSSYEPESAEEYLQMLEAGYKAAHNAYADAVVAHAAFFGASVYLEGLPVTDTTHGIDDVLKVLNRPEIFDVINLHALTDPEDIDDTINWLNDETSQRGYSKQVIISDTTPNSIAIGQVWSCNLPAILMPPADESDRCRIAELFQKLTNDKDEASTRWVQGYNAQDMIKKATIAISRNVSLINLAFSEDLNPYHNTPPIAGTSEWAGIIQKAPLLTDEKRAGFYALKQFIGQINGYESASRIELADDSLRLYELKTPGGKKWIAWLCPDRLSLLGDASPQKNLAFNTGKSSISIEKLIDKFGQTSPEILKMNTTSGMAEITVTPAPVFIY